VEFVVDKVALGQVFLRVLYSSSVTIMPPVLLTRISLVYRRWWIIMQLAALFVTIPKPTGLHSMLQSVDMRT